MAVADGRGIRLAQAINMPDSVQAMNIFYMLADFVAEQSDEDVVNSSVDWIEALYDTIDAQYSDLVELGELTVYLYNGITDQWDNIGTGVPVMVGTQVSDMLPHGVSALVRAYSSNARSIARKYLAGFGEEQQTDGVWGGATLTALAAFGVAWSTSETISPGNGLIPGVFDNTLKAVHRLTGVEVVLANPAYQRRRRPGVGT